MPYLSRLLLKYRDQMSSPFFLVPVFSLLPVINVLTSINLSPTIRSWLSCFPFAVVPKSDSMSAISCSVSSERWFTPMLARDFLTFSFVSLMYSMFSFLFHELIQRGLICSEVNKGSRKRNADALTEAHDWRRSNLLERVWS